MSNEEILKADFFYRVTHASYSLISEANDKLKSEANGVHCLDLLYLNSIRHYPQILSMILLNKEIFYLIGLELKYYNIRVSDAC